MIDSINKIETLFMKIGDFTLTFNKKNGVLENLKYKNEDLVASCDHYKLQLRDEAITAMAVNNQVLKYEKTDTDIIFHLSNPELAGIEIIQEYKILSDQISKKVTFNSSQDIDGFFTYFCGGDLTPEFRKGSVYQTLRGWDVKTIYNADEITELTRIGHPQAHWGSKVVTVSRADKNLVLAHFAWKSNEQFTWLITQMSEESTKYTPTGWFFPAMIFHPETGQANSFESIYQVLNGTHLDFYDDYRNRSEVKSITTKKHPEWLRDTKFELVCWRNSIGDYSNSVQKLLDASRYSPEENALMTIWGWTDWGRFPYKDDDIVFTGHNGEKELTTARKMCEQLSEAKKENPSVKIGLYQLLWSLPPDAEINHPDWMSYTRNGEPIKMHTEPGWVPIYRLLSNPESKKSILTGLDNMYNYYPMDYMYLDGGVRGQVYPDWKTMQCDSANKWLDLWKEIFNNIQSSHPDYALFCNNPFPIYSHAGYSENGSFGRWYDEDWRCLADIFYIVKSFQVPGRFLSVLYRSTGYRTNEPQYTNMLLATGLMPAGSKDPDIHPDLENLAGYLPYINAAFELRDTEIKNAVIAPRYFVPGATMQANVLKLRNCLLISALRHTGDTEQQVELEIDNIKAGLALGESYCLYQIDVKPAKIRSDIKVPEKATVLELESIAETRFLGNIELKGKVSSYQFRLPENHLRFLVLSKSNVRIVKVNDRKTQFELPALLKATVNSQVLDKHMEIEVDNPYDSMTIRVSLPDKFNTDKLSLTPSNLSWEWIGDELEITIAKNINKIIINGD